LRRTRATLTMFSAAPTMRSRLLDKVPGVGTVFLGVSSRLDTSVGHV
jgi:hypothetical protein